MTGQIDRMLAHFAPFVVFRVASSREGLLAPGIWTGVEAIRSIIRLNDQNYQPLEFEVLDIVVEGQRAALRWRGGWRHHGTRKVYMMDAAHFLHWEDGRVVEMREFFERSSTSGPRAISPRPSDWRKDRSPGLSRAEIDDLSRLLGTFKGEPDVELILKHCSPGMFSDFVGDPRRLPYAGRHAGVEALIHIVSAVAVDFEQSICDVSEFLIDGDRVAGCRTVEWRHRGTGRSGLVDLANFVRFEEGKVAEFIEFRDSCVLRNMRGDV